MVVIDNITLEPIGATIEVYRDEIKIHSGLTLPTGLLDTDVITFSHAGYIPLQVRYRDIKGFEAIELERNDLLEPVIITPKKNAGLFALLVAAFLIYKFY